MNKTCVILVLFFALVSCTLSSYLDIPPPPERPVRFKTKEQIETYLKAVKDYYDAFKIKLVRREDLPSDLEMNSDKSINNDADDDDDTDELNDDLHVFKKLYNNYKQNQQPSRKMFRRRETNNIT